MPALPAGISNAINALFTTRGKDGRLQNESFRKDQTMKKKTFDAVAQEQSYLSEWAVGFGKPE
jgi:hypothetical protein